MVSKANERGGNCVVNHGQPRWRKQGGIERGGAYGFVASGAL